MNLTTKSGDQGAIGVADALEFVIGQYEYQLLTSLVSHLAFDSLLRNYYFCMFLEPYILEMLGTTLLVSSPFWFGLAPSFLKSMAVVLTVLNVLHTQITLFHLRWCDTGSTETSVRFFIP